MNPIIIKLINKRMNISECSEQILMHKNYFDECAFFIPERFQLNKTFY